MISIAEPGFRSTLPEAAAATVFESDAHGTPAATVAVIWPSTRRSRPWNTATTSCGSVPWATDVGVTGLPFTAHVIRLATCFGSTAAVNSTSTEAVPLSMSWVRRARRANPNAGVLNACVQVGSFVQAFAPSFSDWIAAT